MTRCTYRRRTASLLPAAFAIFSLLPSPAPFAQEAAPQEEIAGARQVFDGKMFPSVEVNTFQHSEAVLPFKVVSRKSPVHPLSASAVHLPDIRFESTGKHFDLYDYLATNRIAGLLILKDRKVVFEDYELGITSASRWPSFSMAKSVSSTLVGAALQQGLIKSLDDPITQYVPALKGGTYEGVSVRNILQMASGVKWNETYTDPKSDRRKLLEKQLEQKPGSIVAYMNTLSRAGAPGSIWNYNTGESFLVGAVIEGATKKSLATYLSETFWQPLGMEKDATWWTESPGGMGLAGSGLGATLRDYARFAQFVLNDGLIDGKRIVPEGWFNEAGRAHTFAGKSEDYGYLWWPLPHGDAIHDGAFEAIGIFGQHMYINPNEKLAIVVLSARPKPDSSYGFIEDDAFFAAVAKALH